MRAFIAVDLPAVLKEKIANSIIHLKKCDVNAKWVRLENIHLTLKFLGEVKEEQIEEIKRALTEVATGFSPLVAKFTGFGFFPNERRPRVFFVSTDKEEILKDIYQRIENRLEELGFPKENRFKTHITLCRFKSLENIDCIEREVRKVKLEGEFAIEQITLFKSTLSRSGPVYEKIFSASLAK